MKLENSRDTLGSLKPAMHAHPVVKHPFLLAFKSGELSIQQVKLWAQQQFYLSISLPDAFAALFARIPDKHWKEKRAIVDLLHIEAWGSENNNAHSNKFKQLCDFLGVDIDKLTQGQPKPYTQKFIEGRLEICLSRDIAVEQGLAAIALGNELLNIHIYEAYKEGVMKTPGLEGCPLGYFDAHLHDEEADFRVFSIIFEKVARTNADQHAEKGMEEMLHMRHLFFDDLHADLKV